MIIEKQTFYMAPCRFHSLGMLAVATFWQYRFQLDTVSSACEVGVNSRKLHVLSHAFTGEVCFSVSATSK